MNPGAVTQRLFSRATVIFLFVVIVALLGASGYTYLQDRRLHTFSLSALRMASWNLAQLSAEASAFDQEVRLMLEGVGDPDELMLRYDVLWSRFDYLLNSEEAQPTRQTKDNARRLANLFQQLRAMESEIKESLDGAPGGWAEVESLWESQKSELHQVVFDSFVGDEANRLVNSVEESRDRLSNLRFLTLGALVAVFVYFGIAMVFVRRQSRTDQLTGLPNSNYLRTVRSVNPARAIVVCEIREYQLVLSEYGNDKASELVRLFVQKLQKELRNVDELIQISRSEFVILLRPPKGVDVEQVTQRLVAATAFDWRLHESILPISGVYGVAPPCEGLCPGWNTRYQEAHRALARAYLEGQSFYINGEDLEKRFREERLVHNGLLRFFNEEPGPLTLRIVYQPIVRARDCHQITGAEVLLRCNEDSIGFVPPNRVVNLCERYGLGADLGRWLFRQIARETRHLYREMDFLGSLSINLNPAMLSDELVADVQTLLIDEGIPADALCMEITEDNAALEFERINDLIGQLHELGVSFALDDFGTGHSSLEYVRELKVDRLKIDRCFVEGIEDDPDKMRFLGSIIAMAEQAYMKSVIEGVENQTQWDMVHSLGGSLVQGYFAHRPMPFNDFMCLLMDPASEYPMRCNSPRYTLKS